jgi:hypothetical protein
MRDPLNYFEPFESLPAGHENQLTRAFLVVLRMVPLAHGSWLRIVSEGRGPGPDPLPPLERLPEASFQTQTGILDRQHGSAQRLDETSVPRAISVLQAGELPVDDTPAASSDRRAVFDGVVRYGDDLALVIESKLDGRFDERQAREIAIGETAWRLESSRARLRWRDIIGSWRDLLLRNLVSGAERRILEDFLWLVQRHFPRLQPFSELGACRGNLHLLRLRCQAILGDVGAASAEIRGESASLLLDEPLSVKRAYLRSDDGVGTDSTVELRLWPGDTLEQAKALYSDPTKTKGLLALRGSGWQVSPNFHFGHMAKGFVWTQGDILVERYISHWVDEIGATGQIKRADWEAYFDQLISLGIAAASDRAKFDEDFTQTQRNSATPRPGLRVVYSWPFDTAAQLDGRGRFANEVRQAINQLLSALGEPTLPG